MNAHEIVDRFDQATFTRKMIDVLIVVAVVAAVLGGTFWFGTHKARQWSDSAYLAERDQNLAKIAVFENNEKQLAAENALLKKEHEAMAEQLSAADKKTALDGAKKLAEITAEQNKRNAAIDLDNNFDDQICGLCAEMAASGHPLSKEFCKRCDK